MTPDERAVANASGETTAFQRGLTCYRRGEFDRAVEHFTAAIALDPQNAEAYAFRADTNRLRCDYQQAAADYSQALKLRPDYSQAYVHRSLIYQLQGNSEAALEDCSAALVHDPQNAAAYQQRGRLYANRGDWEEALTDLSLSITLNPRALWSYYHRGRVHIARATYDEAITDLSQVLRRNPNHVLAFVERGRAFLLKGVYDRAVKDETAALGLHPENVEAYAVRGDAYRFQGEAARAIADYSRALRLDPVRADLFRNRGLLYRLSDHLDKALADLDQAVILNPSDAENYYERGQVLIATNEFARAVTDFTTALEHDGKHTRARLGRALSCARLGRSTEVQQDCTKALEIDPKLAAAYYLSGSTHLATGQFAQAMMTLSRAIAADGDFALSHNDRGLACLSLGNLDQAIADFEEAIRLDSNNPLAYANRALARMARGESALAAQDFTRAYQQGPKLMLTLWNRGWGVTTRQVHLRTLIDYIEGRHGPEPLRQELHERDLVPEKRDHDEEALAILTGKAPSTQRLKAPAAPSQAANGSAAHLAANTQINMPTAETAVHSVARDLERPAPRVPETPEPQRKPEQKQETPSIYPGSTLDERPEQSPAFEPFDTKCPTCKKQFRALFTLPGTAGRVKCPNCSGTFVPGAFKSPIRKLAVSKWKKSDGPGYFTRRRLVLVGFAAGLLFLAILIVQMLPHKPPMIRMDAAAFWEKYKQNSKTADKLYANQLVSLTGKLDEVRVTGPVSTPNPKAKPEISVQETTIGEASTPSSVKPRAELFLQVPEKSLFRIKCVFDDPAAVEGLKKDQGIMVTGHCQRQLGPRADIRIIGCRLASDE